MDNETRALLEAVRDGKMPVEEALVRLRAEPFEDIGFAKVDLHRKLRQGAAEIIYGAGKTPEQISGILEVMERAGQSPVLITRLSAEAAQEVGRAHPLAYYPQARAAVAGQMPPADGLGTVVVATGGTSDIPVAEEAAITAQFLGNQGVAGLHRTLAHLDDILSASVIIAIAGMEGALASVIGGLADCPVIAVPTSVGYGASFNGLSALLSMLNSCASGVSVVNIDNGFGAGYLASMINHIGLQRGTER